MNHEPISFDDLETGARTMNTTYVQSFIPEAFSALCERKGYRGDLANHIAARTTCDIDIDEAIAVAAIDAHSAGPEAPFNVMSIIGFYQDLMDKVCWNARKLFIANEQATTQTRDTGGIYGLNLAQRAIDSTGVDADNPTVREIVKSDYEHLFITQSELLTVLGMDIDMDLFFFNPSQRNDDGTWTNPHRCESFDDAMQAMNTIADELRERERNDKMAEFKKLRDARLKERLSA